MRFRLVRRFSLARATAPTAAVRTETLIVVIAIETNAAVIISMIFLASLKPLLRAFARHVIPQDRNARIPFNSVCFGFRARLTDNRSECQPRRAHQVQAQSDHAIGSSGSSRRSQLFRVFQA